MLDPNFHRAQTSEIAKSFAISQERTGGWIFAADDRQLVLFGGFLMWRAPPGSWRPSSGDAADYEARVSASYRDVF